MTRVSQNLEVNNLGGGLNTEASPLTFPQGYTLDEQNMLIQKDGSRKRRNGLVRETHYDTVAAQEKPFYFTFNNPGVNHPNPPLTTNYIFDKYNKGFIWAINSYGDQSNYKFEPDTGVLTPLGPVSIQTGGFPFIGYTRANTSAVVGDYLISPVSYDTSGYDRETTLVSNLYDYTDYDVLDLTVRDLWGQYGTFASVKDNDTRRRLISSTRVTTVEGAEVYYNLRNGTYPFVYNCYRTETGTIEFKDTLFRHAFLSGSARLPSHSDNFWAYCNDTEYREDIYVKQPSYRTLSPVRGSFTISPFYRSWNRRSAYNAALLEIQSEYNSYTPAIDYSYSELPVEYTLDRSTGHVHSYVGHLGRVWCAIDGEITNRISTTPDLNALVFFSQVIKDPSDCVKCHSEVSPGDEEYALLDTDGGFVNVLGVTKIIRLEPLGRNLIVFGENGIWKISGGEENFSATSVSVSRLSNVFNYYPHAIVNTGTTIYFWTDSGIYSLTADNLALEGGVTSISYNTVDSIAKETPNKELIRGEYDEISNEVRWMYYDPSNEKNATKVLRCNSELVLDVATGTFSKNVFGLSSETAVLSDLIPLGYIKSFPVTRTDSDKDSSLRVAVWDKSFTGTMTVYLYNWTGEDFIDFPETSSGIEPEAYLLTGYVTAGDSQRKKQAGYITCNFERTEDGFTGSEELGWEPTHPSGCLMQTQWEWTNSAASGKWGREQQVYRLPRLYVPDDPSTDDWSDFGYTVISSRTKVRGMGKALSLLFKAEPGKDFHLLGWGANASISQNV